MPQSQKVRVYKYKNIGIALAILLLIIVAISTACNSSRAEKKKQIKKTKAAAVQTQQEKEEESSEAAPKFTRNYKFIDQKDAVKLGSGELVLIDGSHPFDGEHISAVGLYEYLFDSSQHQVMSCRTTLIQGEQEMLEQLNKLAVDFAAQSGLDTLMVYGLIPDETQALGREDEAYSGYCVDLMLYDRLAGSFSEFNTEGQYAWIKDNCYKYGFIIRDGGRLRYIGTVAAGYIHDNNTTFESFMEDIKNYTFEVPLFYTDSVAVEYALYYTEKTEDGLTTPVPVPLRDDESELPYEILGNNVDGYIAIVRLSENVSFDEYYEQGKTGGDTADAQTQTDDDSHTAEEDI
ncbi:MAG: hypothetical protein IJ737_04535 [Ruminococcus sp.]|nr:hypothetical protein [Ruminococcus sp.]